MDLFTKEGFRVDGRLSHEIREISVNHSMDHNIHQIEYIHGETHVIARLQNDAFSNFTIRNKKDKINVIILYMESALRDRVRNDNIIDEFQEILKSTFNHSILSDNVTVEVFIKQDNGGVLSCIFNAITLILCLGGIGMLDVCLSAEVGVIKFNKKFIVIHDLSSDEERIGAKMFVAYFPQRKSIGFLKATEIDGDVFKQAFEAALTSVNQVFDFLNDFLKNNNASKRFIQ